MHCRDKAFIVAERVYFKTQCIYISFLSRDTTLISSQMRSCYVFSLVSPPPPPFEHWSIRLHYLERGEGGVFLSRFTIYLVTRLFAAFLPSHGGWLTWNASSAFVASLILDLLSKLSGYSRMSGISDSRFREELLS